MQSAYDKIHYYEFGKKEKARIIAKLKAFLAKEKRIKLAILFGSVTRRNYGRDIDLCIHATPELNFKELLSLNAQIELELGIPVDLVELSNLSGALKAEIIKKGTLIKGDKLSQR
ncbi:MAG: nucleotidyltransferase domain-containing protein [Candidatus Bathyarchaeota archaeon]|nr:nucleotidyltransferase domain-containing protein [Candidatus Bathyarchaeota archaeon]